MSLNTHPAPVHPMPTFGPLAAHAGPYLKLTLPAKFYNVPPEAPALFSTRNGTRVKRQLLSPPPAPVVRSDFDEEVKRMAALLRQELPQVAGLIRNPTSWKDLYYFFDSVDLWIEGAVFLYFVISHISRDNVVSQEAQHRMQQSAMIFQYAGNWVAENADRIAKLPSGTDFLTLFGPLQRADIRGFRPHELEAMREAIRFHHARLREKYNSAIRTHCIDTSRQVAPHSTETTQNCVAPRVSQVQPLPPAPLPAPNKVDQYNHNVGSISPTVEIQPNSHPQVVEAQTIHSNALPNHPPNLGHTQKESINEQRQLRSHGYSNDARYGGRSHSMAYPPQGSLSPPAEQLVTTNSSHRSPLGAISKVDRPVYVHNSRRVSPPHFQQAATSSRAYSDPHSSRNGASNNARLWNDSCQVSGRQSQTGHERFNKHGFQNNSYHQRSLSIPFKDHPNARITTKASTFFYKRDAMDQKYEYFNHRTLYIHGAPVEMFLSHALQAMMSEVGTVESISYLYGNPLLGPAFITFAEESAVKAGIARFNGFSINSGRQWEAKVPEKNYKFARDRSDSQSSQIYANHNPTYPSRQNPRNIRKNSVSSRQYDRSYHAGDDMRYSNNSPGSHKAQTPPHHPQSHAPQVQGPVLLPSAMPLPFEYSHSNMAEIVQHQAALDRLPTPQMSLEPVDHYSSGNKKSTGPLYAPFAGSKKENLPLKSISKNTTPDVTPKKEGFQPYISAPHTPEAVSSGHQSIDLVETLRASARQKSLIFPINAHVPNNASRDSMTYFAADVSPPSTNMVHMIHSASESKPLPAMVRSERPASALVSTVAVESAGVGPRHDGGQPKSKKIQKNRKKQASLRREVSSSTKSTATTTTTVSSVDTTSPTLTDATSYKSAATSFSEVSSRNHSFASAKSIVSLPTTNDSSVDEIMPSTPTPAAKHSKVGSSSSGSFSTPKAINSRNQCASKSFNNQSTSSDSRGHTFTTDRTGSNDKRPSSENTKLSSTETPDSDNGDTGVAPITSLENHDEWPALERTNGTTSEIAGKARTATVHATTGHNTTGISKNSNAVIPALPLNMIPQRRNSYDLAESKAWPRVRRCVGK